MRVQVLMVVVLVMCGVIRAQAPGAADIAEEARRQQAAKAMADAERALTQRLLDGLIAQSDVANALLADARMKAKALSERLEKIRTSDEGKRLAAALNEISARDLQRLLNGPPVLPETLGGIERQLDASNAELRKWRAEPPAGFLPPEGRTREMAEIKVRLIDVLARMNERAGWLDALISTAPKDLDVSKAATLDAVLIDFRRRQQEAWSAAQKEGVREAQPEALNEIREAAKRAELDRALEESRRIIAETEAEMQRMRIAHESQIRLQKEEQARQVADLERKLSESEAVRRKQQAQSEAIIEQGKLEAEKVRLKQKCKDPEVQKLLAPFLSPGYWQPPNGKSIDKGPVSLSKLRQVGALERSDKGIVALANTATHPLDKERPRWGIPQRLPNIVRLTGDQLEMVKKGQDLLNELGETMVELGMLAK